MRYTNLIYTIVIYLVVTSPAGAKIDLVTLPGRDKTQLTIYNSADLTLVREERTLTLKKGTNRLEFGWENTLIDPTSVQLYAPGNSEKVRLLEVQYPPNVKGSAVWIIDSDIEGAVPVEITFFTSGIHWRAFYAGTLSQDEKTMQLDGYITIQNYSGEDYENAATRVIVGKIHLLDQIAQLAGRENPYNRPGYLLTHPMTQAESDLKMKAYRELSRSEGLADAVKEAKNIIKEGLSEYFLYSIEGTENIPNGWGKRLPSFSINNIPVHNLYRYEEERYGMNTHRMIYFKNNKFHKLGQEPLPDGNIKIFKQVNTDRNLSYTGQVHSKYIPIDQEVELDIGPAKEVQIKPVLMSDKTDNYLFNSKGNISGYDRIQQWEIQIENNRNLPVAIEVWRNFSGPWWEIDNSFKNKGDYEKIDIDSVKYTLKLPANTKTTLAYTLTQFEGERQSSR